MKTQTLSPLVVDFMPAALEPGVLYISLAYETTAHLCACGCGNKVVPPISPAEWRVGFAGDGTVSMHPSIGNWEFPCRSHYVIKHNQIRWAGAWSQEQVERGRARDIAALQLQHNRRTAGLAARLRNLLRRITRR